MIDTANPTTGVVQSPPVTQEVPEQIEPEVKEREEVWYKKMWRPALAGIYAAIVIFDFMVMPVVIEVSNTRQSNDVQAVELALKFKDSSSQIQALKTFAENRSWSPLTLMGGGMFHVAFGALLTGAAFTRGMEKKEHASRGVVLK